MTCDNCHDTCQTCTTGAYNDCTSCDPEDNLWLRKDLQECVEDCGVERYQEPATQTCEYCDSSCGCCDGSSPSDCTCCNEGTYLYEGVCGNCPAAYYGDDEDWTCKPCDGTCCNCNGPEVTDCSDCCHETTGLYLTTEKSCVYPCSDGNYADPDGTC